MAKTFYQPNFIRPALRPTASSNPAPVRPIHPTLPTRTAVGQNAAPPTESPTYVQFLAGLTARCSLIFVDEGTVLRPGFEPMLRSLIPHLKKFSRRLEVGQAVFRVLRKLSAETPAAATALGALNALQTVGLVHPYGDPNNTSLSPKAEILKAVAEQVWSTGSDILVLTQSADLAQDLAKFGSFGSIQPAFSVVVKRIRNEFGQLGDFVETPVNAAKQPSAASVSTTNAVLSRLGL